MRTLALALTLVLLVQFPSRAAEPRPQYSPQQLEQDFAKPATTDADACAARGMTAAPDGSCEPSLGKKRGFSLAAPDVRATGGPAKRHVGHPAPVPSGHGRDLLITFANASNTLTEQAKANARAFARALNSPSLRSVRFAIDGHTNAVGGRDYNLALSRGRARALVDFLVGQGVDRSRFDVNGYGFDRPADAKHPAAPSNRRVEARRLN